MADRGVMRRSARSAVSTSRSADAHAPALGHVALLESYRPVCDGIARVLWPRAEVVLHDLPRDLILHIANPMSGRAAGDRSMAGDIAQTEMTGDVIGPYEKRNFDGRRLKSTMSAIRMQDGLLVGILCINMDVDSLVAAVEHIREFAAVVPVTPRPAALFGVDWREQVNKTVGEFLVSRAVTLERLDAMAQLALLRLLDQRGFFAIRTAVPYVASVLGLSRATIYAKLAEARRGAD